MSRRTLLFIAVAALIMFVPVLSACGATPTPTAAPTAAPTKAVATSAPPTAAPTKAPTTAPTKPPATATTVPPTPTKGPTVGGKLVYAVYGDPDTLDSHKTSIATAAVVLNLLGSAPLALNPKGEVVPYLADSWMISPDGLTWEIKLKKNVKFHNGTALTAKDYVWTFDRIRNPDTKSTLAAAQLQPVQSWEAVDDYTLKLTLKQPMFSFTYNLTGAWLLQPLHKATVESAGGQYGRTIVVGVGPYKFKEWKVGERVVIERNADFNWSPPFVHQGPAYIETIEYRLIPEVATLVAGFESGELDFTDHYASIQAKDIPRIQATGKYEVFEGLQQGMRPYVLMNVTRDPFTDVKVRQALNLAVDRKAMITIRTQGNGVEQKGPLSPSTIGYWPEVEKFGYGFDPAKAKALLAEAGYKAGAGGILEKDGKPLRFVISCLPQDLWVKAAEILQEQYKALGIETTISQVEPAVAIKTAQAGGYDAMLMGVTGSEADLMYMLFHSSNLGGGYNMSQVNDPELDKLLSLTRTETDAAKRQEVVNAAQKTIVEDALVVFLYVPKTFSLLNTRVKGAVFSQTTNTTYLHDAYIEVK